MFLIQSDDFSHQKILKEKKRNRKRSGREELVGTNGVMSQQMLQSEERRGDERAGEERR